MRGFDRDSAELRRTGPGAASSRSSRSSPTRRSTSSRPPSPSTGAAVALLVTTGPLEKALSNIEWPTLFFFVGLFVMVGALEEPGAIGEVADASKT